MGRGGGGEKEKGRGVGSEQQCFALEFFFHVEEQQRLQMPSRSFPAIVTQCVRAVAMDMSEG